MKQITTNTLSQVLELLPEQWSEPSIDTHDENAISATFAKENIMITILTNPETNFTTASYIKIGTLPKEIEEKDVDELLRKMNKFLITTHKIENF